MTKLAPFIGLLLFASCNSGNSATSNDSTAVGTTDSSKTEVSYPYEIGYSTKFEFADPEKSKMILGLWKDYDNNTFDKAKDKFADSVTMLLPGLQMHTTPDSVIASMKAYRNTFNSAISKVDVVMSVKSTDKNEDWVLVWGSEIHTNKKNVTDTVDLQEVWGLNADGKVKFMQQYMSHK